MIELQNLTVSPFVGTSTTDPILLRVAWEVAVTSEDLDGYEFTVYRSNSPEDDYVLTSPPLINAFEYIDQDVNLYSKNRIFYYKVRAKNIETGREVEIGPVRVEDEPDTIGIEIIRRNNLLLKRFVGMPCAILIRRTFGQRCGSCWDETKQRVSRSDCTDCFGTGFSKGYFQQINNYVNFNPNPKIVNITVLGEFQPSETSAWMSNYPSMSPGDVIVEDTNRRWRVAASDQTRKQRHIIHQVLRLVEIKRNDVEYRFEIENPDSIVTIIDEAFRKEHTVISRRNQVRKVKSRSVPV